MRTLLIAAGGTGGHITPGIAIARMMTDRGWTVRWIGTAHGMENRLVPNAGLPLDTIPFAGLRGKGAAHALRGAFQLLGGLGRSLRLVHQLAPDVVLGMGGYVTVPVGLAAGALMRPLVLMNSDASLLLSNRILAPVAKAIAFGLPPKGLRGTDPESNPRWRWTGSPVNASITALPPPAERYAQRTGPLRMLVVGGSLGASVLNRIVPEAIALLPPESRPQLVHQTGPSDRDEVERRYRSLSIEAEVIAFIDDMASQYSEADVVLCRAGAITVNELCCAGVASLLVPLTVSTTSHQADNARYLDGANAAIHIPQGELSAQRLSERLRGLDRTICASLAAHARELARPGATAAVAELLETMSKTERRT